MGEQRSARQLPLFRDFTIQITINSIMGVVRATPPNAADPIRVCRKLDYYYDLRHVHRCDFARHREPAGALVNNRSAARGNTPPFKITDARQTK